MKRKKKRRLGNRKKGKEKAFKSRHAVKEKGGEKRCAMAGG